MYNQEEIEYQKFIDKFIKSVSDLTCDFKKLNSNNQSRANEYFVNLIKAQGSLEILNIITNHHKLWHHIDNILHVWYDDYAKQIE